MSLIVFATVLLLTTFAELVSNDRPLVARYDGQWFFPVVSNPPETRFGGDFKSQTDWHDPFIRQQFARDGNFALFTLNAYAGNTVNYFDPVPAPAPPSRHNLLGTDESGRDMLGRLIYGFRVSVWFGLALTAIGVALGVMMGALQGYFGGRVDLAMQRLIEIWNAIPELYVLIIIASIFEPSILLLLVVLAIFGWVGLVRLRARRIPAQPQPRIREGGARDGAVQRADHLAAPAAELDDAGHHVPAVPDERRHPGARRARLPGLWASPTCRRWATCCGRARTTSTRGGSRCRRSSCWC